MSDTPSVADAGETAPAPGDGDLLVSEIDQGYGDIGYLIEWANLADGWLLAEDTDSYVSLDANL